jgi:hypothetical protein
MLLNGIRHAPAAAPPRKAEVFMAYFRVKFSFT